jgi:hypothetical protein
MKVALILHQQRAAIVADWEAGAASAKLQMSSTNIGCCGKPSCITC